MNLDSITPVTYDDRNFFHDAGNIGFLGDFVETLDSEARRGRIYDCHFMCPESDFWLRGQTLLGSDPMRWKPCRWVSVLVEGGGAIVVPEQLVRVIEPFPLDNDNWGLYWPQSEKEGGS